MKNQLQSLIAKNKLEQIFKFIAPLNEEGKELYEKYKKLEKQDRLGMVTRSDFYAKHADILSDLIRIVSDLNFLPLGDTKNTLEA